MARLARCGYGEVVDVEFHENCCLRGHEGFQAWHRCPVFDSEPCPFGKKVEGCGTCANCAGMSLDGDGNRTVDCAANPMQMHQPYATSCVHWEKALG